MIADDEDLRIKQPGGQQVEKSQRWKDCPVRVQEAKERRRKVVNRKTL